MKVCRCNVCSIVHQAAPASALDGLSEEMNYARTHCRLCESPSSAFVPLADEPDVPADEIGYPLAVVPWLSDAPL